MKVKLSLFNVKLLIHIITFLLCVITYANSKYANFFYAFILFETLFLVITQRNFSDIKKAFKNIIIILLFYLVFFIVSILFNEFKVNSIKAGISILLTPAIIFNAVIFYNELTMKDVVKIRKIYFKIQLQINTKCDSIEQDEKREKEGEKSARNRAKT